MPIPNPNGGALTDAASARALLTAKQCPQDIRTSVILSSTIPVIDAETGLEVVVYVNNAPVAGPCNAANENVVVTLVAPLGTGIPTLSEWAMGMLGALLAVAAFAAMRRRAR